MCFLHAPAHRIQTRFPRQPKPGLLSLRASKRFRFAQACLQSRASMRVRRAHVMLATPRSCMGSAGTPGLYRARTARSARTQSWPCRTTTSPANQQGVSPRTAPVPRTSARRNKASATPPRQQQRCMHTNRGGRRPRSTAGQAASAGFRGGARTGKDPTRSSSHSTFLLVDLASPFAMGGFDTAPHGAAAPAQNLPTTKKGASPPVPGRPMGPRTQGAE